VDLVGLLYRPLTRPAAHRVLIGRPRSRQEPERGRFTRANVDDLLGIAWDLYRKRALDLQPQPTIGSAMNLRLACFTLAFLDTLLAEAVDRDYAIELVADAAWWVYRRWARIALATGRLTPWKRTVLGFATIAPHDGRDTVSLRFPFNAPGYLVENVAVARGVGFDVVRCPVAEFFRAQGAADLCLASWCNLDYALAEMTQDGLARSKTLVGGEGRCDFRLNQR
jgi:hypothetical protein